MVDWMKAVKWKPPHFYFRNRMAWGRIFVSWSRARALIGQPPSANQPCALFPRVAGCTQVKFNNVYLLSYGLWGGGSSSPSIWLFPYNVHQDSGVHCQHQMAFIKSNWCIFVASTMHLSAELGSHILCSESTLTIMHSICLISYEHYIKHPASQHLLQLVYSCDSGF